MADDQKPLDGITNAFDIARDEAAAEKLHNAESEHLQYEAKIKYGKIAEDDTPKIINKGRVDNGENSPQKKEERRRKDQDYIVKVLDQMRERLAVLEQQMAERYIVLQAKYGEDAIGGMAAEFLGDQAADLRTEQERMEALAEHFLDPNGEIKPEFVGMEEAIYVRDWNEAQSLRQVVLQFDGRNDLSENELLAAKAAASSLGYTQNLNQLNNTENTAHNAVTTQAMADVLETGQSVKSDTSLAFK